MEDTTWMSRALELESQIDMIKKEVEILSTSNFDRVKEFHATFAKNKDPKNPTPPTQQAIVTRMKLMCEEMQEVFKELGMEVTFNVTIIPDHKIAMDKLAKEYIDLLYVTYGGAAEAGIDADAVFEAVHKSNMSKLDKNGKPVYRDDGKVLKSELYVPPDIKSVLIKRKSKVRA